MARAAEIGAARVRNGLADPRAARLAKEARRPIGDHLAEYIAAVASKGGDPKHVRQTRT
ncbi:hypothetical protein TA3x_005207 [Tundrisphaera sp. TA3]|uniref:hypothetical protein n=1 Tax=Tundrisphaera sp. TA3 TaxID=3435775 RepID=UPI003EB72E18